MNEIVPAEDGAPARRAPMMAGARPMAIVPTSMDDAYRLGKAIVLSGTAPKGMDTPEKCMIAIMRGLEVGLTPMQAIDKIAIVNGRPTIWGDGAIGLVRGSGLCEWIRETIDGAGDSMIAKCEAKRRGDPEAIPRTFSVSDAKKAGLWGKQGPWQQYPTRMLAMRARAFCLRDGFADVLGGLYLREELDDAGDAQPQRRAPSPFTAPQIEHQPEREYKTETQADAQPEPAPQPTQKARRAPSPGDATKQPAKQEQPPVASGYDPERVRAAFDKAAGSAKDRDQLNDAWETTVGPFWDDIPEGHPDKSDLDRLYRQHAARVDGEEGAEP